MAIDDSDSEIDTANLKPAAKKTRKASNAGTANNKSEGKKDYLVDYKSEYKWLDLKGQVRRFIITLRATIVLDLPSLTVRRTGEVHGGVGHHV